MRLHGCAPPCEGNGAKGDTDRVECHLREVRLLRRMRASPLSAPALIPWRNHFRRTLRLAPDSALAPGTSPGALLSQEHGIGLVTALGVPPARGSHHVGTEYRCVSRCHVKSAFGVGRSCLAESEENSPIHASRFETVDSRGLMACVPASLGALVC